jgi:hypothetical protein
MPIEIRELVIRANVPNKTVRENQQPSGEISAEQKQRLKKEILEDCLDKILTILERKLQR